MIHSGHIFRPSVPEPDLSNSPRLDQLIRDGKLYLSIRNAIELALENNLDLAIARYNLPIADTDIFGVPVRVGPFAASAQAWCRPHRLVEQYRRCRGPAPGVTLRAAAGGAGSGRSGLGAKHAGARIISQFLRSHHLQQP